MIMIRGTAHRPLRGIARRRTAGLISARITSRGHPRPPVLIRAPISVLTGRCIGCDLMTGTTVGGILR